MTEKNRSKLYFAISFIFATISLIAGFKLLYNFYYFVQNYLNMK
jgi:hypothetical protein